MCASSVKPELLAPAGDRAAFEAAIAAGADAIYLGAQGLNARRNAGNFAAADLAAACRDAHLRERKVYLTANTLVFPGEMDEALKTVSDAADAGIDAAIIQDIGLMRAVRRELPGLELHTSTQMDIRDEAGIEFARKLGASRVTLARELSLKQIAKLAESDIPLEVFVHGALCVCRSGQCLMSSMVGGRSANRGLCAQPCRLPYEMVDAAGKRLSDAGEFLLSPRDLCGLEVLDKLIDAGVASLKIEGRMKSAEYVSTVTGAYRSALDRAWVDGDMFEVNEEERSGVSEAFSRGFTTAYLTGDTGNEMMGYKRPNNRGVLVGRVSGFAEGMVRVDNKQPLLVGDLLEVWTSKGRVTHEVTSADDLREGRVQLFIRGAVSPGDRIFRIRSAQLRVDADERTSRGWAIPLTFQVTMVEGKQLAVTVVDDQGYTGSATGAHVEAARTKAVTREDVIEHVGRLGGTPYEPVEWDIDLSENVGIGFSALHKVRKAALEDYERNVSIAAPAPTHEPSYVNDAAEDEDESLIVRKSMASFATTIDWNDTDIAQTIAEFAPGSAIGPRLYATNPEAVAAWKELGASFVWLSPELTLKQIRNLADTAVLPLGIVVSGRQELMVSDHCFLRAQGDCNRKCASCKRRKNPTFLKDRKGYLLPVTSDERGRGHIYNAVPLDVAYTIPDLEAAGVTGFAADVTLLEGNMPEAMLQRVQSGLNRKNVPKAEGATTGHLFREVE